MPFWKVQVSFLSNFASFFIAIKNNPLYFFSSNIFFSQKEPIRVQIFETLVRSDQNSSNCGINFQTTSQFLFEFCIIPHCHDT